MVNNSGSEWRKWDFHVHTPYSILNNNYGFDPYTDVDEKKFDEFVQKLFLKALECNIQAIGITDYFVIDGYKRIKECYLECPAKMETLFPNEEIRKQVEKIYIFPNIEVRLNTFVGEKANAVNYHIIFSDSLSAQIIEENFLHRLTFQQDAGDDKPLTKYNIEEYGKSIRENNGNKGSDFLIGLKHVTVSSENILEILRSNAFGGKYFITVPVDEDLSAISWKGRDYSSRKNIYQQCHFYMTSNAGTASWALANVEKEERIREFGSIKPCIWGSDAHEYKRMFKPADNKYCWIKAEPTFDGLRQILYEPEARVCIQKEVPDSKKDYLVIDSVEIVHDDFFKQVIPLNSGLNTIIGGRSSGKSILLGCIARLCGSEKMIKEQNQEYDSYIDDIVSKSALYWKDGLEPQKRKIDFFPQGYIIDFASKNKGENQRKELIEPLLREEQQYCDGLDVLQDFYSTHTGILHTQYSRFCVLRQECRELKEKLDGYGSKAGIESEIHKIENQIKALRETMTDKLDEAQEKLFEAQKLEIATLEYQIEKANEDIRRLQFPSVRDVFSDVALDIDGVSESVMVLVDDAFKAVVDTSSKEWILRLDGIIGELKDKVTVARNSINSIKSDSNFVKAERLFEKNKDYQDLSKSLSEEQGKMKLIIDTEQILTDKIIQTGQCLQELVDKHVEFYQKDKEFCDMVNMQHGDISITARLTFKSEIYQGLVESYFHGRAKNNYGIFDYHFTDLQTYKKHIKTVMNNLLCEKCQYTLKRSTTIDKVAEELITQNFFSIEYDIQYQGDNLNSMSEGKKSFVILRLLLDFSKNNYPILIDQPEDDLDNRAIYHELVQYLRDKKGVRQIILVTHNPNIVVGADAEEVIVANQNGIHNENPESKKFCYRTGALEESFNNEKQECILYQYGIREHVCEILEGGKDAFRIREQKYNLSE